MKPFRVMKNRSAKYARSRIELLLTSERLDCSPQMMTMLKNDLIHTVKKYIPVNGEQAVVRIKQEPPVIHAEIPVCMQRNKGKND